MDISKDIAITSNGDIEQVSNIAKQLNINIIGKNNPKDIKDYFAIISIKDNIISLQQCGKNSPGPIFVDFSSEQYNYRRKFGGGKNQMIAKAVGMGKIKNPYVIDATAGFGKDSFILASLGCKVDMIERSNIAYLLLSNGLERSHQNPDIADITNRMTLTNTDTVNYLESLETKPDVIYLDPMFPDSGKSALVKKEMQLFHKIIGKDEDANILLETVIKFSPKRIVVKRPIKAPYLADNKPSYKLEGKTNRYDIYL